MSNKNLKIIIEDETGINHYYIAEFDSEYKCHEIIILDNYHKNVTFGYDSERSFKLSDIEPYESNASNMFMNIKKYVKKIRVDDMFVTVYIWFVRCPHDGYDRFYINTCSSISLWK